MKRLLVAASIFIGCALPACAYTLNDHEMKLVQNGFGADPVFAEIKAVEASGNVVVCGRVNAKNQYGQYMGDAIFAGSLLGQGDDAASFFLFNEGVNPSSQKANEIFCRQYGITF